MNVIGALCSILTNRDLNEKKRNKYKIEKKNDMCINTQKYILY